MADADVPMILPAQLLAMWGVTEQEVMEQYPQMTMYSDKALYAIADSIRKSLVGVHGTNLQMINAINNSQDKEMLVSIHVGLFLVKNQMKPMEIDAKLLGAGVTATMDLLAEGDMHAVNRRAQLTAEGVLKPDGDDVVPLAVREEWISVP